MRLIDEVCAESTLEIAFRYAFNDRIKRSKYFNLTEMIYYLNNRLELLEEIRQSLESPEGYKTATAYTYFIPKSEFCERRMLNLSFKDLVVRFAVAIVLADRLDADLIPSCFANRRCRGEDAQRFLLESFSERGWPNFCVWQAEQLKSYQVLAKTDISTFYDTISHDELIRGIAKELVLEIEDPFLQLLKKLLEVKSVMYLSSSEGVKEQTLKHGLATGPECDGLFANLYLKHIDEQFCAHFIQNDRVSYARYNDDIRIFARDRESAIEALQLLQRLLWSKGLNLNATKTKIAIGSEELRLYQSEDLPQNYLEDQYEEVPFSDYMTVTLGQHHDTKPDNKLKNSLDVPFNSRINFFGPLHEVKSEEVKKYLNFLKITQDTKFIPDEKAKASLRTAFGSQWLSTWRVRTIHQVNQLWHILTTWRDNTNYAAWLLMETAFIARYVTEDAKQEARRIVLRTLRSSSVSIFAKIRLLHHLIKERKYPQRKPISLSRRETFRIQYWRSSWMKTLNNQESIELQEILRELLHTPSFALVFMVINSYLAMGKDLKQITPLLKVLPSTLTQSEPYRDFINKIHSINILRADHLPILNNYSSENPRVITATSRSTHRVGKNLLEFVPFYEDEEEGY